MSVLRLSHSIVLAALLAAVPCERATAAPEEIQVYMDDVDSPGTFGLDTHVNYVSSGEVTDDYDGQQQSRHRLRITPEFSYGITSFLEAGLYLPLATIDQNGREDIDGLKGRLKFIVPQSETRDWWYGMNFELGRVSRRLDVNPWNAELKAMTGTHRGPLAVAFNLNLDFVVSGPRPTPSSLEGDVKISYAVAKRLSIGIESYNGLGDTKEIGRFNRSEQSTFLAADTSFGKWDLNLGVGRGYGTNPDRIIVKAILSVPIERLMRGK